jgi:hypothetical protein
MADEIQNGMHCAEFETLLFEAIDGTLIAGTLTRFEKHASTCASCGPLFADAQAGQQWMRSLADVEPPKNLIHNILARTSGVEERYVESVIEIKLSRWQQAIGWVQPVLSGTWATVRQPRFGMSVAMAFFSVSLVMSVAGIKVSDVAKVDLHPSAIKRSYYSTQARVVKYYSNMRGFYEIESMLHSIQRATTPAEGEPSKREKPKPKENNKTSSRPNAGQDGKGEDHNQDQNYAQDDTQPVMAQAGATGNADGNFELRPDAGGPEIACSEIARRKA